MLPVSTAVSAGSSVGRPAMTPIRVAIVGAGGQVGPKLLAYLADDPGMQVRGICRNEVTAGPLRIEGFDIRCGSVGDIETAQRLLGDCEVILNCAAASGTTTALQAREQDQAILRSLCSLPGKKRLVHFSSVGVYGTCLDARRNRFENPRPDWSYGREKLRLERFLAHHSRGTGHEIVVLRMGHVYGAGQWVSRQVLETARDPRRRLPFDGQRASNAVHVHNVAAAIRTLIVDWARPGTYNLCDSPPATWRQVFDWNTNAVGMTPVPGMDPDESARWLAYYRRVTAMPPSV